MVYAYPNVINEQLCSQGVNCPRELEIDPPCLPGQKCPKKLYEPSSKDDCGKPKTYTKFCLKYL